MSRPVVRNQFWDQLGAAVRRHVAVDDATLDRLLHAFYLAYWQGWRDGLEARGESEPGGAAGRGVIAALPAFRGTP